MADILSQEEIDRLMESSGSEVAVEDSAVSLVDPAALEKLLKVLFASANSALATLLARPASVSGGPGHIVDIAGLDTTRGFLMQFPFHSGFSGKMAFLVNHRVASILADLILGGDGVAKPVLDEADLEALKETMTQVTGTGAPTLSATLGCDVRFGAPEILEVEQGDLTEALPWGRAFLGTGMIMVDELLETPFRILLPLGAAQEMVQALRDEGDEAKSRLTPTPFSPIADELPRPTASAGDRNIELILDIEVAVTVRLGETEMPLKEIQRLRPGSIIDLDKDTETPVELVVNDKVIAMGELVVVSSDHFALRITDIETPSERIRRLGP